MKPPAKKWYLAVLLVKVTVAGENDKRPLFDRQFRLLRAASHEGAFKKALRLGKQENQSYKNFSRKVVKWRFMGLADLVVVSEAELADGVEVYSTVRRGDLEREISRKADLGVFWYEANKHRTQGELTSPSRLRYAPAAALRWIGRQIQASKERAARGGRA